MKHCCSLGLNFPANASNADRLPMIVCFEILVSINGFMFFQVGKPHLSARCGLFFSSSAKVLNLLLTFFERGHDSQAFAAVIVGQPVGQQFGIAHPIHR